MIVVGISPGLVCLEYVILRWDGRLATYTDSDRNATLGRRGADVQRRVNVHRLILSVVVERAEPEVLVGLSPPYSASEGVDEVNAVRGVIEELVQTAGGRTASWDTQAELYASLSELEGERVTRKNVRTVVEGYLRTPLPHRARPVVEATAAAILAARWADSTRN